MAEGALELLNNHLPLIHVKHLSQFQTHHQIAWIQFPCIIPTFQFHPSMEYIFPYYFPVHVESILNTSPNNLAPFVENFPT